MRCCILYVFITGEDSLCLESFGKMWRVCFSHVKIRLYKAVTGKCTTCTVLSQARKCYRDKATRAHITQLHALHRTMYMGERMAYYRKRQLALSEPDNYLSIISDGMAQVFTFDRLILMAVLFISFMISEPLQIAMARGVEGRQY